MTLPDDPCWLLVAPAEVGLLHRLRPAVRAGRGDVLVHLDRPPVPAGAQLGLARGGTLTWFGAPPDGGGLTAADVATAVRLVSAGAAGDLPTALPHRVVGRSTAQVSDRGASPRT